MRLNYLNIIILMFFISNLNCQNGKQKRVGKTYFNDTIKVDNENIPLDKNESYAPKEFELNMFGFYLPLMKEQLLYNKPIEGEIFRLTWLRSFHNPIVIKIRKLNDNYTLTWKEVKKEKIRTELTKDTIVEFTAEIENKFNRLIEKHTFKDQINLNQNKWNTFRELVDIANFWDLDTKTNNIGLDGSTWYLEYASKTDYKIVEKWSPNKNSEFYKACDYLINLTKIKNLKKY